MLGVLHISVYKCLRVCVKEGVQSVCKYAWRRNFGGHCFMMITQCSASTKQPLFTFLYTQQNDCFSLFQLLLAYVFYALHFLPVYRFRVYSFNVQAFYWHSFMRPHTHPPAGLSEARINLLSVYQATCKTATPSTNTHTICVDMKVPFRKHVECRSLVCQGCVLLSLSEKSFHKLNN